jgi:isoaspartyl peptidase/L-asparaginase-like protein (Ntn-hydrolase superfamily)
VGNGAYLYAKENDQLCVDSLTNMDNYLVTDDKRRKWKTLLDKVEKSQEITESIEEHQDTVGAICIDFQGNIASGVSSGGIWLKHSGRVGEAGIYGAGCWARNETDKSIGFGCSCTGTGEDIMLGLLGKNLDSLMQTLPIDEAIKTAIDSCSTMSGTEKKIGLISATLSENTILFGFGFTTQGMGVAWFSSKINDPIVMTLVYSSSPPYRSTITLHQHSFRLQKLDSDQSKSSKSELPIKTRIHNF